MVALLPANVPTKDKDGTNDKPQCENRVISVLMRRLGSSRTFGENLIFMLNRAGDYYPVLDVQRSPDTES